METISLEDIRESGHIKVETCKSCMEDLKGIFTKEQLQWFEAVFYSNTAGRIFKRKEVQSDEYMILEGTVCFRRT